MPPANSPVWQEVSFLASDGVLEAAEGEGGPVERAELVQVAGGDEGVEGVEGGAAAAGAEGGRRGHAEEAREELEEEEAERVGHASGAAVEDVDDDGAGAGGGGDHDHVEAVVGADERDLVGGRGDVLGEEEEHDKEGGEDVHAEEHLGGRLGRQEEEHGGERGEEDAGQHQDVLVEAALALHLDRVGDVGEDLLAALVLLHVALALRRDHVPLVGGEQQLLVDLGPAQELDVDRVARVGPRAELHAALLVVVGEVLDVDLARGLVDGRRPPPHLALRRHDRQHLALLLQPRVRVVVQHYVYSQATS